jgi:cell division protein FtsI/penicillin-binding protein 2
MKQHHRPRVVAPRRLAPLAIAAALAFVAGLVVGALYVPPAGRAAARFAKAWERGDYAAMYALLSDDSRNRTSPQRFAQAYRDAARTLTLVRLDTGKVRARGNRADVPVTLTTRIFGTLAGTLTLPTGARAAGGRGVDWSGALVFPGLRPGERLSRTTRMPPRAAILARDGTVIAHGPNRTSALGPVAAQIAGVLGPAPPERAAELAERGVPPDARVGLTGLERQFDDRLAGRPGGTLRGGARVLATSQPVRGANVRTTISPAVQRAAVEALAGRYGGIAAIRPRDGQVLALAGIAYSAPQPPGSTFKIVTLAGLLSHHVVSRRAVFPVQTQALLSGVPLQNANGEACGGTLEQSFAESCNSVFAPLGARLGARRLVAAAEAFGFNEPPALLGQARSTIPPAGEIGDDLAVGSSAIGQGKVQATPLQMALVAAAIGMRGRRARPTLDLGARPVVTRATSRAVARTIATYMRAVVTGGTGIAAAVPGVAVAGKTGTAELRNTVRPSPSATPGPATPPPTNDPRDTDAWFVAFAPLKHPRIAVAVLLVGAGAGGATAAPAARPVIQAALKR